MKKFVIFLSLCIFIIMFAAVFLPFRPTITVKNESSERLYLHFDEIKHDVEPTPEEVDRIVKSKSDIVEPGATFKLTTSFSSLMISGIELNIGWLTGGEYSYNAIGGGGQNFIITSKQGECSFSLTVRDGYNNYVLNSQKGRFCTMKLSPL